MDLFSNPCIYNSMSFVIIEKEEIAGSKAHHSGFNTDNLCSYSTNDLVLF